MNLILYGFEKYNGVKCAVAEFKVSDINLTIKIWSDVQKGTVLKTSNIGIDDTGREYEIVEEYTVTYNVVTDEEVKKPDLTGYTLIETDGETNDIDPSKFPSITIDDGKTMLDGPGLQEQNYVILD